MQSRLHVLAILSVSLLISSGVALGQTPGTATVTITGKLQGPIYACGNSLCPTYDSGQLQIKVNGFNTTTYYDNTSGHTAEALARQLTNQLNTTSSPVTAIRSSGKITLKSKITGTSSNYPLSTSVTHSTLFAQNSFAATPSGPTLTGGSGGPAPMGTLVRQLSNNTSLCSSSSDPGGNRPYCTAFFNGFNTNPNDLSPETLVPDSPAGHVS